jgi:hypothetical protein
MKPTKVLSQQADGMAPEVALAKPKNPRDLIAFLSFLTRILVFLSLGIAVFLSIRLFFMQPVPKNVMESAAEDPEVSAAKQGFPVAAPFSDYEQVFKSRDLFAIEEEQPVQVEMAQPAPIAPPVVVQRDLSQELKLVGILLDDRPQAVLEDLKNQTTIFLHKGESHGDIVLEDVQEGKVTIRYHNELVELTP